MSIEAAPDSGLYGYTVITIGAFLLFLVWSYVYPVVLGFITTALCRLFLKKQIRFIKIGSVSLSLLWCTIHIKNIIVVKDDYCIRLVDGSYRYRWWVSRCLKKNVDADGKLRRNFIELSGLEIQLFDNTSIYNFMHIQNMKSEHIGAEDERANAGAESSFGIQRAYQNLKHRLWLKFCTQFTVKILLNRGSVLIGNPQFKNILIGYFHSAYVNYEFVAAKSETSGLSNSQAEANVSQLKLSLVPNGQHESSRDSRDKTDKARYSQNLSAYYGEYLARLGIDSSIWNEQQPTLGSYPLLSDGTVYPQAHSENWKGLKRFTQAVDRVEEPNLLIVLGLQVSYCYEAAHFDDSTKTQGEMDASSPPSPFWSTTLIFDHTTVNYGPWTHHQILLLMHFFFPSMKSEDYDNQDLELDNDANLKRSSHFAIYFHFRSQFLLSIPVHSTNTFSTFSESSNLEHGSKLAKPYSSCSESFDYFRLKIKDMLVEHKVTLQTPMDRKRFKVFVDSITCIKDMSHNKSLFATKPSLKQVLFFFKVMQVSLTTRNPRGLDRPTALNVFVNADSGNVQLYRNHIDSLVQLSQSILHSPHYSDSEASYYKILNDFRPALYRFKFVLNHSDFFFNVNEYNIVSSFSDTKSNSYCVLSSSRLSIDCRLPMLSFSPLKTKFMFDVRFKTAELKCAYPALSTMVLLDERCKSIISAPEVVLLGRYIMYSGVLAEADLWKTGHSPSNLLKLDFRIENANFVVLGSHFRFLSIFISNFFGEHTQVVQSRDLKQRLLRQVSLESQRLASPNSVPLELVITLEAKRTTFTVPVHLYCMDDSFELKARRTVLSFRMFRDLECSVSIMPIYICVKARRYDLKKKPTLLYIRAFYFSLQRTYGTAFERLSLKPYRHLIKLSAGNVSMTVEPSRLLDMLGCYRNFLYHYEDRDNVVDRFDLERQGVQSGAVDVSRLEHLTVYCSVEAVDVNLMTDEGIFRWQLESGMKMVYDNFCTPEFRDYVRLSVPGIRMSVLTPSVFGRDGGRRERVSEQKYVETGEVWIPELVICSMALIRDRDVARRLALQQLKFLRLADCSRRKRYSYFWTETSTCWCQPIERCWIRRFFQTLPVARFRVSLYDRLSGMWDSSGREAGSFGLESGFESSVGHRVKGEYGSGYESLRAGASTGVYSDSSVSSDEFLFGSRSRRAAERSSSRLAQYVLRFSFLPFEQSSIGFLLADLCSSGRDAAPEDQVREGDRLAGSMESPRVEREDVGRGQSTKEGDEFADACKWDGEDSEQLKEFVLSPPKEDHLTCVNVRGSVSISFSSVALDSLTHAMHRHLCREVGVDSLLDSLQFQILDTLRLDQQSVVPGVENRRSSRVEVSSVRLAVFELDDNSTVGSVAALLSVGGLKYTVSSVECSFAPTYYVNDALGLPAVIWRPMSADALLTLAGLEFCIRQWGSRVGPAARLASSGGAESAEVVRDRGEVWCSSCVECRQTPFKLVRRLWGGGLERELGLEGCRYWTVAEFGSTEVRINRQLDVAWVSAVQRVLARLRVFLPMARTVTDRFANDSVRLLFFMELLLRLEAKNRPFEMGASVSSEYLEQHYTSWRHFSSWNLVYAMRSHIGRILKEGRLSRRSYGRLCLKFSEPATATRSPVDWVSIVDLRQALKQVVVVSLERFSGSLGERSDELELLARLVQSFYAQSVIDLQRSDSTERFRVLVGEVRVVAFSAESRSWSVASGVTPEQALAVFSPCTVGGVYEVSGAVRPDSLKSSASAEHKSQLEKKLWKQYKLSARTSKYRRGESPPSARASSVPVYVYLVDHSVLGEAKLSFRAELGAIRVCLVQDLLCVLPIMNLGRRLSSFESAEEVKPVAGFVFELLDLPSLRSLLSSDASARDNSARGHFCGVVDSGLSCCGELELGELSALTAESRRDSVGLRLEGARLFLTAGVGESRRARSVSLALIWRARSVEFGMSVREEARRGTEPVRPLNLRVEDSSAALAYSAYAAFRLPFDVVKIEGVEEDFFSAVFRFYLLEFDYRHRHVDCLIELLQECLVCLEASSAMRSTSRSAELGYGSLLVAAESDTSDTDEAYTKKSNASSSVFYSGGHAMFKQHPRRRRCFLSYVRVGRVSATAEELASVDIRYEAEAVRGLYCAVSSDRRERRRRGERLKLSLKDHRLALDCGRSRSKRESLVPPPPFLSPSESASAPCLNFSLPSVYVYTKTRPCNGADSLAAISVKVASFARVVASPVLVELILFWYVLFKEAALPRTTERLRRVRSLLNSLGRVGWRDEEGRARKEASVVLYRVKVQVLGASVRAVFPSAYVGLSVASGHLIVSTVSAYPDVQVQVNRLCLTAAGREGGSSLGRRKRAGDFCMASTWIELLSSVKVQNFSDDKRFAGGAVRRGGASWKGGQFESLWVYVNSLLIAVESSIAFSALWIWSYCSSCYGDLKRYLGRARELLEGEEEGARVAAKEQSEFGRLSSTSGGFLESLDRAVFLSVQVKRFGVYLPYRSELYSARLLELAKLEKLSLYSSIVLKVEFASLSGRLVQARGLGVGRDGEGSGGAGFGWQGREKQTKLLASACLKIFAVGFRTAVRQESSVSLEDGGIWALDEHNQVSLASSDFEICFTEDERRVTRGVVNVLSEGQKLVLSSDIYTRLLIIRYSLLSSGWKWGEFAASEGEGESGGGGGGDEGASFSEFCLDVSLCTESGFLDLYSLSAAKGSRGAHHQEKLRRAARKGEAPPTFSQIAKIPIPKIALKYRKESRYDFSPEPTRGAVPRARHENYLTFESQPAHVLLFPDFVFFYDSLQSQTELTHAFASEVERREGREVGESVGTAVRQTSGWTVSLRMFSMDLTLDSSPYSKTCLKVRLLRSSVLYQKYYRSADGASAPEWSSLCRYFCMEIKSAEISIENPSFEKETLAFAKLELLRAYTSHVVSEEGEGGWRFPFSALAGVAEARFCRGHPLDSSLTPCFVQLEKLTNFLSARYLNEVLLFFRVWNEGVRLMRQSEAREGDGLRRRGSGSELGEKKSAGFLELVRNGYSICLYGVARVVDFKLDLGSSLPQARLRIGGVLANWIACRPCEADPFGRAHLAVVELDRLSLSLEGTISGEIQLSCASFRSKRSVSTYASWDRPPGLVEEGAESGLDRRHRQELAFGSFSAELSHVLFPFLAVCFGCLEVGVTDTWIAREDDETRVEPCTSFDAVLSAPRVQLACESVPILVTMLDRLERTIRDQRERADTQMSSMSRLLKIRRRHASTQTKVTEGFSRVYLWYYSPTELNKSDRSAEQKVGKKKRERSDALGFLKVSSHQIEILLYHHSFRDPCWFSFKLDFCQLMLKKSLRGVAGARADVCRELTLALNSGLIMRCSEKTSGGLISAKSRVKSDTIFKIPATTLVQNSVQRVGCAELEIYLVTEFGGAVQVSKDLSLYNELRTLFAAYMQTYNLRMEARGENWIKHSGVKRAQEDGRLGGSSRGEESVRSSSTAQPSYHLGGNKPNSPLPAKSADGSSVLPDYGSAGGPARAASSSEDRERPGAAASKKRPFFRIKRFDLNPQVDVFCELTPSFFTVLEWMGIKDGKKACLEVLHDMVASLEAVLANAEELNR